MLLVFEEIWNRIPDLSSPIQDECKVLGNYVSQAWIDDQIRYHEKNHERNLKKSKRFETWGEMVFWFALAAAVIHCALPHFVPKFHNVLTAVFLTFVTLILPAAAATLEGIRFHREYKRIFFR